MAENLLYLYLYVKVNTGNIKRKYNKKYKKSKDIITMIMTNYMKIHGPAHINVMLR